MRKLVGNTCGTNKFIGPNAYYPEHEITKSKLTREITFWSIQLFYNSKIFNFNLYKFLFLS